MLKHCELFGGIGGFSLAILWWFSQSIETIAYCDIDEDAIAVYHSHFPDVKIHRDIRTFHPTRGDYDLITAGFPCTGTSFAGKQEGFNHPDSALWREAFRIMCQVRPQFFIWEQPLGIVRNGLRTILGGCRMAGYSVEVIAIAASELGAWHERKRIFAIASAFPLGSIAYLDDGQQRRLHGLREAIERVRTDSQWLATQPGRNGSNAGVSVGLVRGSQFKEFPQWLCPNGTWRRKQRRLAGKTVTPAQAAIALSRISPIQIAYNSTETEENQRQAKEASEREFIASE